MEQMVSTTFEQVFTTTPSRVNVELDRSVEFLHDPTTIEGHQEWSQFGLCKKHPELDWFVEGMTGPAVEMRTECKRKCAKCPVLEQCKKWALKRETHGVWAGMSERERKRIRREQRIVMDIPGTFFLDARRVGFSEGAPTVPDHFFATTNYRHLTLRGEAV